LIKRRGFGLSLFVRGFYSGLTVAIMGETVYGRDLGGRLAENQNRIHHHGHQLP
jgi:hypothetical protein